MKSLIIVFVLVTIGISFCNAQNILLYIGDPVFAYFSTFYTIPLTQLGYSYKLIVNAPLTSDDFVGIDLFFDITITDSLTGCPDSFENSLPAIQNFLESGGSAYWTFENSNFRPCDQYKMVNLVNPYINLPNIALGANIDVNGVVNFTSSLPSYKTGILTTPNDIARREEIFYGTGGVAFAGVDTGSIFAVIGSQTYGVVYGGDDLVYGGRYFLLGDIRQDFVFNLDIFENIVVYLLCDAENECNGLECGTGVCGDYCPNTCGATEVCVENTCCDTTIECDGFECGTGICGGDCTNTCDATEVCEGNTCVCDTTIECDGLECGTGVCGGDCPNSCASFEICDVNACICDVANECDGFECGIGICGGSCPYVL